MEYMNCEQYVLGELEEAQAAVERLARENDRLRARCELLEGQLNAPKDRIQEVVEERGRKAVFRDWFNICAEVEGMSFEDWRIEASDCYQMPKTLKAGAIRFFEPELREAYEKKKSEEAENA